MCDDIHYRASNVNFYSLLAYLHVMKTDKLQNISRIDSLIIILQNQVTKK